MTSLSLQLVHPPEPFPADPGAPGLSAEHEALVDRARLAGASEPHIRTLASVLRLTETSAGDTISAADLDLPRSTRRRHLLALERLGVIEVTRRGRAPVVIKVCHSVAHLSGQWHTCAAQGGTLDPAESPPGPIRGVPRCATPQTDLINRSDQTEGFTNEMDLSAAAAEPAPPQVDRRGGRLRARLGAIERRHLQNPHDLAVLHRAAVRKGWQPDSERGLIRVVSAAMCTLRKMDAGKLREPGAFFTALINGKGSSGETLFTRNITQADEDAALRLIKGADMARRDNGETSGGRLFHPEPTEPSGEPAWIEDPPMSVADDAKYLDRLYAWCAQHKLDPPTLRWLNEERREHRKRPWNVERWEHAQRKLRELKR